MNVTVDVRDTFQQAFVQGHIEIEDCAELAEADDEKGPRA